MLDSVNTKEKEFVKLFKASELVDKVWTIKLAESKTKFSEIQQVLDSMVECLKTIGSDKLTKGVK
jgi:hypothetical protein